MSEAELVIRPFRPSDETVINQGFNETFRLERSLEEWAWKFPPQPEGRLIMLAEIDDAMVAHYAGMPLRFTIDGREWNAAQIVDVFSTRAARRGFTRKGVWVRTVEEFFSTFGESGRVAMLYGFPSPRPLRLGVLQLGYDAVEPHHASHATGHVEAGLVGVELSARREAVRVVRIVSVGRVGAVDLNLGVVVQTVVICVNKIIQYTIVVEIRRYALGL